MKRPRLYISDGQPDFESYDASVEAYEKAMEEKFEIQLDFSFIKCEPCETPFECIRLQVCKLEKS